ncbi:hypothetical protein [Clostridium hydrogenum]|nr:hypothetical protein [Clostridium hydrogenum]
MKFKFMDKDEYLKWGYRDNLANKYDNYVMVKKGGGSRDAC